jgi:hypothetical protein
LDAAAEIPKSRKLECFFICLFGLWKSRLALKNIHMFNADNIFHGSEISPAILL